MFFHPNKALRAFDGERCLKGQEPCHMAIICYMFDHILWTDSSLTFYLDHGNQPPYDKNCFPRPDATNEGTY